MWSASCSKELVLASCVLSWAAWPVGSECMIRALGQANVQNGRLLVSVFHAAPDPCMVVKMGMQKCPESHSSP